MTSEYEEPALTGAELDELGFTFKVKSELERHAFSTKWFDYRFLHPVQATAEYIRQFGRVYRRSFGQNFDRERSNAIRVLEVKDLYELTPKRRSNLGGAWKGRLVADLIGMPYDLFISTAFDQVLRAWKRPHLPQATQLYKPEVVEKIIERWKEMQAARLYVAENPRYQTCNYMGTREQNDHHEWLFAQAGLRQNRLEYLADFHRRDLLPMTKIQTRLEPEQVAELQRLN